MTESNGDHLKILYHHRIGSKDGQAVHVAGLINALRRRGHDVDIVSPPSFERTHFGGEATWLARLRHHLPRMAYEILEVFYNLPLFWRLERSRRRISPDLIYERYNLFVIAGVLCARFHQIPIFLEINAPLAQERTAFGGLALRRLAAWVERRTWQAADIVLPVSQVLAEMVAQAGVPPERVVVIPNGVDELDVQLRDSDEAKRALGLQGKTVLGFVGFIREWHGLDEIIYLLKESTCPPEAHLLIVGDGPALGALMRTAARLGLSERVTFSGVVDRNAVADHIAAFDIALQPKAIGYASPLKIFEYMAAGKPIVAPNQANIREILINRESALLFDIDNRNSFRDVVTQLANDARLRYRLGTSARRQLLDRGFTWSRNASRIGELHRYLKESGAAAPHGRLS